MARARRGLGGGRSTDGEAIPVRGLEAATGQGGSRGVEVGYRKQGGKTGSQRDHPQARARPCPPEAAAKQEVFKELGTTCSTCGERRPSLPAEAQKFAKKWFPSKQVQWQAYEADSTAPAAEELDKED